MFLSTSSGRLLKRVPYFRDDPDVLSFVTQFLLNVLHVFGLPDEGGKHNIDTLFHAKLEIFLEWERKIVTVKQN